ncbi:MULTISPECIES: lysylphosphatidylglycerol synthase transmembrane domain-containing protein [unclassified Methanoregula]|uniref:lysylphosphatidylglycerol synthase transmembrane domain-containing protein n=1 Tax=unclassified Methanoregula TaxID=2649730 RepID=UPI0009C529BA|nr:MULTISPECIES: lysylphosphatidylglycerol synthase transmembrane domain-containing protein [unclassified Methanoregula]OPX61987.1 MAG: Glycosyltransferase AglD [Methanoregula sp. PtaB.Bin085]OPY34338.1 MAG: Glycosyltransferase AglD [Methanoregula sp. PtaU1.Bin006]
MYRKISAIAIPTLIAVGILGYMLYSIRDDLIVAIRHIIPLYLAIAVAICLCAWWLRGWRYHSILKSLNYTVSVTVSTACIFVSQTVNLILPARLGDFVRIFILKHEYGTTYSEGISSLVVERVFDIITVALLGAVSLLFILNAPAWFTTLIIVPLAAGALFFLFLLLIGRFSSENRYLMIILNMLHEIRRASLNIRSIIILSISSIIIWLLDVLVCYAVVRMFDEQIPFVIIVLGIVIGNLVKAVPLTPGGMGTYEAALWFTFGLAGGVSASAAILIAIIDHLIKNLVTLVGGIVSIYYLGDWVVPTIKTALDSRLEGGEPPAS